jgi:phosphoenolpyruvate-protein phosphotransferase
MGLGEAILGVEEGDLLILDGEAGQVLINPPPEVVAEYSTRAQAAQAEKARAQTEARLPAISCDGRRVAVYANIGSIEGALAVALSGAEGVGLFRTEFLFLERQTAPTEEQQYEAYRAAAQALGGLPLIIRTLDIGGDKPLPYLTSPPEANPFLGWRALRLCLAMPELFKAQLRAILRTAAAFPVKLMFPMVTTLGEFRAAKALLDEAQTELRQEGLEAPDYLEVGMMVEVPAAALQAEAFAPETDFFSIGTNDLAQYTLAAERGNPRLAALSDPYHPAVLKLIQRVEAAAHAHGKSVAVCGEIAADLQAVPLLVGLGVDELSVNPVSVPEVKRLIRSLDYEQAKSLAAEALRAESAEAVRAALLA